MTAPPGQSPPPQSPGTGPGPNGPSIGVGAMVVLAISAALIFWAGLSLGNQTVGRSETERSAIGALIETYQRISDEFVGRAEPEELVDGAIRGMFETLDDPYSVFMGADEYGARFEDVTGEFGGIGAVMNTQDGQGEPCEPISADCGLVVLEVLIDTPALAAGLLARDRITGVDGGDIEGLTIDDTVAIIRGPEGTAVTLTLERDGVNEELRITRDRIVTQDVRSASLADGRVGYLRLDRFGANSADDFEDALRAQLDADVEGLVVDLRGDPGGFVDAAVAITSEFIGEGPVFWEEDADGTQVSIDAQGGGLATAAELPLALLVDGGSASASELVAGALQDAGRATLVGEPTFGKGSVQEWTELPGENGGFRLSVARWLTRDKRQIDGTGLVPDAFVRADGNVYRPVEGADPDTDAQLAYALALVLDEPLPSSMPAAAVPVEVALDPEPSPAAASSPEPEASQGAASSPLPLR